MKEVSKNPLISIILPVYNGDKYIEPCLNQLINQNYKNIELIVINDGSSDNTSNIIKKIQKQDKRIFLIDKENTGVSDSRNIGMKKAKGDYIAFIDVDDIIDKDIYSKMVSNIIKTNSDVSICNYKELFVSNNKYVPSKYNLKNAVLDREEALNNYLLDKISPAIWDKLYKKELLDEIEFEKKLNVGEDLLFCLNVFLKANKVSALEDYLYIYIQQDNSVMHKISPKLLQFKNVIKFVNKNDNIYLEKSFNDQYDFFKLEMITRGIHSISTNSNKFTKKEAIKYLKEYYNKEDFNKIIKNNYFPKSVKIEIFILKTFSIRIHLLFTKGYKIIRNIIRKIKK